MVLGYVWHDVVHIYLITRSFHTLSVSGCICHIICCYHFIFILGLSVKLMYSKASTVSISYFVAQHSTQHILIQQSTYTQITSIAIFSRQLLLIQHTQITLIAIFSRQLLLIQHTQITLIAIFSRQLLLMYPNHFNRYFQSIAPFNSTYPNHFNSYLQ